MDATLAIALAALSISVYSTFLVPIYRKLFLRPALRLNANGPLQVLFGPFGPCVQLAGSIHAVNSQIFLSSLEAEVVHVLTGDQQTFVWRLLFPDVFVREPGAPVKTDIPVGKIIAPERVYRFQAMFNEPNIEKSTIRDVKKKVSTDWIRSLSDFVNETHRNSPEAISQLMAEADSARRSLFLEFMKSETFARAKEEMERIFHWKSGEHHIVLRARTSDPSKYFVERWRFHLTDADIQTLRFNIEFSVGELAGIPSMIYSGVTVDLLPVSD